MRSGRLRLSHSRAVDRFPLFLTMLRRCNPDSHSRRYHRAGRAIGSRLGQSQLGQAHRNDLRPMQSRRNALACDHAGIAPSTAIRSPGGRIPPTGLRRLPFPKGDDRRSARVSGRQGANDPQLIGVFSLLINKEKHWHSGVKCEAAESPCGVHRRERPDRTTLAAVTSLAALRASPRCRRCEIVQAALALASFPALTLLKVAP
jgi:hypothetical protein